MLFLIAMMGALATPDITPLTDEAMALIEPGLTCSAITQDGETIFVTDGSLALVGINGKSVRIQDTDDTMGLPEHLSGDGVTLTVEESGPPVFLEEEERSYSPARLVVEMPSGVSRMNVQFSCGA